MNPTDKNYLIKQLERMVVKQNAYNIVPRPEWMAQDIPWHRAIYMEFVEFADHLNCWKWWKGPKPDFKQAQMELVDIVHFMLSVDVSGRHKDFLGAQQVLQAYFPGDQGHPGMRASAADQLPYYGRQVAEAYCTVIEGYQDRFDKGDYPKFDPKNQTQVDEAYNLLDQVISKVAARDLSSSFNILMHFWTHLGFEPKTLPLLYFSKSVLNQFRLRHGYQSGTYIKEWRVDGQPTLEDNEYLFELLETKTKELSSSNEPEVLLNQYLEDMYAKVVANAKR